MKIKSKSMLFDLSYKLNSGEKPLGLVRKHWFMLALPVAECLIIILLLAAFVNKFFIFREFLLFFLALGLICIAYAFYKWILWRADFYLITNERIVKVAQAGILDRSMGEVSLKDIRDVSMKARGLAATVLKFGTVKVQLDSGRIFRLENISNPGKVYQAIIKLKEL